MLRDPSVGASQSRCRSGPTFLSLRIVKFSTSFVGAHAKSAPLEYNTMSRSVCTVKSVPEQQGCFICEPVQSVLAITISLGLRSNA